MSQLSLTGAGRSAIGKLYVYDTFTGVNGTSLDAHMPEIYAVAGWTERNGDWDIDTNRARPGTANPNLATIDAGVSDCEIEVEINVVIANANGIVARYTNNSNYWSIYIDGTNFSITRIQAGIGTVVVTSATATGAGTHKLWVRLSGATITARLNDVIEIQYDDATFNQTATQHGLRGRFQTHAQFEYISIGKVTTSVLATVDLTVGLYDYLPLSENSGVRTSLVTAATLSPVAAVGSADGLVYPKAAAFSRTVVNYLEADALAFANFDSSGSWTIAACLYADTLTELPGLCPYNFFVSRATWGRLDGGYCAMIRNSGQLITGLRGMSPDEHNVNHGSLGGSTGRWMIARFWYDHVSNRHYNQLDLQDISNNEDALLGPNTISTTYKFRVGVDENTTEGGIWGPWDGRIGPIVFWNRVLTISEWTWMYNGGNFRAYADL